MKHQPINTGAITPRQLLALAGLTVAAFIFNTSEFMPVGLLTTIAQSFSLTPARAGIMITVYAWAVLILSLPLMMAASRIEFKRLALIVMLTFGAGQFLSALSTRFILLIAARLIVASAHAIFWSIVMVMAARVVDPEHSAQALGIVAAGSSVAQIVGLPLGRAIGLAVGWRATFALVGVVALVCMVYLAIVFPTMGAPEPFGIAKLPGLFSNQALRMLYVVAILFATGHYTAYSYIEPFLGDVAGFSAHSITVSLMVFGCAGLAGSIAFSRLYDQHKQSFLIGCMTITPLALLVLVIMARFVPTTYLTLIFWGISSTGYGIAFQAVLMSCTKPSESSVAMSIYSGLFNLGIGAGSAIGGAVVDTCGLSLIGLVGGAIGVAGLVVALLGLMPALKKHASQI